MGVEEKEKRYSLVEEMNLYNMEKEKCEKSMLDKEVAMKEMIPILVDLEGFLNHLEMEKRLMMKTTEEMHLCSLQKMATSSQVMDRLLENIPILYVEFASNV